MIIRLIIGCILTIYSMNITFTLIDSSCLNSPLDFTLYMLMIGIPLIIGLYLFLGGLYEIYIKKQLELYGEKVYIKVGESVLSGLILIGLIITDITHYIYSPKKEDVTILNKKVGFLKLVSKYGNGKYFEALYDNNINALYIIKPLKEEELPDQVKFVFAYYKSAEEKEKEEIEEKIKKNTIIVNGVEYVKSDWNKR